MKQLKAALQSNEAARRAAHEQVQAGTSFTSDAWGRLQGADDHFAPAARNALTNNTNAAPSFAETAALLHRGRKA